MERIYDLIIIGGGSAGLAAGIYSGRAKLDALIIEKGTPGGQITNTAEVVNYPGIRRTTGPDLMHEMHLHAADFGVEIVHSEINSVDFSKEVKVLQTTTGELQSRAVIIATGASPRKIGFPGEQEYTGRGIAYCATCDGEFFSGLDIFVIGGGFAAAEEAIFLTRYGKQVTVIVRGDDFTCAKMIADQVKSHPNINVRYNTQVKSVSGDDLMNQAVFLNTTTNEEYIYHASKEDQTFGMFIFAGYEPATKIVKDHVKLDQDGYVITNDKMETNVPGIYAAGDLRPKVLRQIVTAVADGAIAATVAEKYIAKEKERLGISSNIKTVSEKKTPAIAPEQKKHVSETKEPSEPLTGFISNEMKAQLAGIFDKINQDVTIVTIIDTDNQKTLEMNAFLDEITALSPHLNVQTYRLGENVEIERKIGLDKLPVAAFFDQEGTYRGVKFSGIPGGHEMNSFVLALYNLAGPGQPIEAIVKTEIEALTVKKKLEICVSLSCHFCPEVVAAAQRIAILNPNIEAEMIDISLFPEIKKQYKIMSVPALVIDRNRVVFGSKKLEEIVAELTK